MGVPCGAIQNAECPLSRLQSAVQSVLQNAIQNSGCHLECIAKCNTLFEVQWGCHSAQCRTRNIDFPGCKVPSRVYCNMQYRTLDAIRRVLQNAIHFFRSNGGAMRCKTERRMSTFPAAKCHPECIAKCNTEFRLPFGVYCKMQYTF